MAASGDIQEEIRLITVRAGSQDFGLDMLAVREIRGWSQPTPLPQAPHFVCGMVQLRGTVIPVIDLGDRLGLGRASPTAKSVLVMVDHGTRLVGLLVDSVSDLAVLSKASLQPAPQLHDGAGPGFVDATAALEGRILSILRLQSVIPELPAAAA
ncbi:MAG TPA: chemotaxis protein CheW [Rhizomicrobium sp.]|nr:chemotaxis protein CheW [Rhizomicrobium sp.]